MSKKEKKPSAPWQELNQRPVLKRMIGSYLLVLAVPLVLCLLLYAYSNRTIRADSEAMYGSTLKQVGIDMDAYLTEVHQVLNQVLLDAAFQRATRIGPTVEPEDQLRLVDAVAELSRVQLSHPNISNVFLVLNQPDQAVSTTAGAMDQQQFFQTYYPSNQFDAQRLRNYMRQPHHQWDMLSVDCGRNGRYLLFSRSFSESGGTANATAVVVVDLALLTGRLEQFTWDPQLKLFAVHPDGSVVCGTGQETGLDMASELLQPGEDFQQVTSGGQGYSMMVRGSANSAWRYVLLVSNRLLAQSARRIQLYTFLGMVLCMVISLVLSLRLANQSYHPLMQLMSYFSGQETPAPPEHTNEYARLEAYIQLMFQQRSQEQHALWNSQQSLEKYRLYTLLERPGRAGHTGPVSQLLPPTSVYLVIVFTIPQPEEPLPQGQISFDLLQYAITNIFEEVAGAHFSVAATNTGEGVAAILGLETAEGPVPAQLEEDVQFTQQQLLEHFHLAISAAIGAPHQELSGIHYSYLEALEAASYLNAGEQGDLVAYLDIQDAQSSYAFPLEDEQRLIALVSAGEAQNAQKLITRIFDGLPMRQAVQSAGVMRCLAYDVASALTKGASMAGVNGISVGVLAELSHCPTGELPGRLQKQAALLCGEVHRQTQDLTPAGQMCDKIRTYIAENYQDPELNISMIGIHFDRTPAYLSSIFKKETGMSLLGYLTQVRLDAVKTLLLQGQPLTKIAEQTGFRDSGALIRVFKRNTGMTPGQYRDAN